MGITIGVRLSRIPPVGKAEHRFALFLFFIPQILTNFFLLY